jgi:hypothetical protein
MAPAQRQAVGSGAAAGSWPAHGVRPPLARVAGCLRSLSFAAPSPRDFSRVWGCPGVVRDEEVGGGPSRECCAAPGSRGCFSPGGPGLAGPSVWSSSQAASSQMSGP